MEETGYKATRFLPLLHGPVSAGLTSDMVDMVLATGLTKVGKAAGDGTECIKLHEIPLTQVDLWLTRMKQKGCLIEPKIYAGLYFLSKYNKNS